MCIRDSFDIGTAEPYSNSGEAVRQRDKLIEVIQQKEKDTDYKTAYQYVICLLYTSRCV